jgi:hypothetical protein
MVLPARGGSITGSLSPMAADGWAVTKPPYAPGFRPDEQYCSATELYRMRPVRRVSKIEQRRQAECDRLMANVVGRPRAVPAAPDRPAPSSFGPNADWVVKHQQTDLQTSGSGKNVQESTFASEQLDFRLLQQNLPIAEIADASRSEKICSSSNLG